MTGLRMALEPGYVLQCLATNSASFGVAGAEKGMHVVLVGTGDSVLPALRLMFQRDEIPVSIQYEGWLCSFYIYHGTMEF